MYELVAQGDKCSVVLSQECLFLQCPHVTAVMCTSAKLLNKTKQWYRQQWPTPHGPFCRLRVLFAAVQTDLSRIVIQKTEKIQLSKAAVVLLRDALLLHLHHLSAAW